MNSHRRRGLLELSPLTWNFHNFLFFILITCHNAASIDAANARKSRRSSLRDSGGSVRNRGRLPGERGFPFPQRKLAVEPRCVL